MERILKLIYGYIMILVKGEQLERFLNLCRNRKVYMERIRYINSDQLTAQLNARDFLRLRHCVPGLFRAIREYRRGSVYLLRLISLLPFQTVSQDIR